jgi:hypothetical protein
MIDTIADYFGGIPREAVIALLLLVAVQLTVQIFALADLARRPTVRTGKKWVWAIVIIAGSILGAILYFAFGRTEGAAEHAAESAPDGARTGSRDALDRLYGSSPPEDKR